MCETLNQFFHGHLLIFPALLAEYAGIQGQHTSPWMEDTFRTTPPFLAAGLGLLFPFLPM